MKKTIALISGILLCANLYACSKAPCEHNYQETITKEASCSEPGEKTYTCKRCKDSYTEQISQKEHNYIKTSEIIATCTVSGTVIKTCSYCGKKSEVNSPALGHSTKNGICSRCSNAVGLSQDDVQKYVILAGLVVQPGTYSSGQKVTVAYKNTSPKQIKYITFSVTPYNAVYDVKKCNITNASTQNIRITGPIPSGYANYVEDWGYNSDYYVTADAIFTNVWYNNDICYIKLNKIVIEYMDGSVVTIGEDLAYKAFIPCKDNHIR